MPVCNRVVGLWQREARLCSLYLKEPKMQFRGKAQRIAEVSLCFTGEQFARTLAAR